MQLLKRFVKRIPAVQNYINNLRSNLNPNIRDIIEPLFNNKANLHILDIGANEGQSIELFNSIFILPKIISFEPTPDLSNLLKSKYQNENIEIVELALGDKYGNIDFYVSEHSPTNSVLKPNYEKYLKYDKNLAASLYASAIIKVKMLPLDDWIAENMQGVVFDILKIDTQGFDYSIIKGGEQVITNNVKVVILEIQFSEYYHGNGKAFEIMQLMNQLDFELLNLVEMNRREITLVECNAIFVNNKYCSSLNV